MLYLPLYLMVRQFLAICFSLSSFLVLAQTDKGELLPDEMVSNEIGGQDKHRYTIQLDKNQYAFLRVMQRGIDLMITTYDRKGEELEEFDSPNGTNGPEFFSIISDKKGKFSFEVYPLGEDQEAGAYDLEVLRIKEKATTLEERVDELFLPWDNEQSPGASVAIVKDGAITYSNGYGMANLEYDIPNTPSTIFHIASVSKQFAAFSILLLQQDGELTLDDDVRDYIPEVPDFGHKITLRHLAHHTSGLRDQWNLLAMAGWRLDDVITTEQVLKLVSQQKELNFEPGSEYLYCNTGFTLLAEVVARVSGKSFAEFTKERIFDPLEMSNTLFYDDHQKIVKNRAYSYYGDAEGFKKRVLSYATVGATSLFTTVEDLSRWSMNFDNMTVGDAAMYDDLRTRGILTSGDTIGYALGIGIGEYRGLRRVAHAGGDAGYRTYFARFPDQDFTVIVFSNQASFNPGGIGHKIVDIYLEDKLATDEEAEEEETADESEALTVDPDTLAAYEGQYELQPGFVITISLDDDQLKGQATGQSQFDLKAISTTAFEVQGVEAKVEFHRNDDNEVHLLKLYQGGQIMDAPRMAPFDADSVELEAYTGEYFSAELWTSYRFVVEDGQLIARHGRHADIELTPTKPDVFSGSVWFFRQVEMERGEDNAIIGCKVSNGRVRNLKFERAE